MGAYTMTRIGSPLKHIPVRHACGHYEARYTRWNAFDPRTSEDPANANGFLTAESPCSSCAPQGRPISEHWDTLHACKVACAEKNSPASAALNAFQELNKYAETTGCRAEGPDGYICTHHNATEHIARGMSPNAFAEAWPR